MEKLILVTTLIPFFILFSVLPETLSENEIKFICKDGSAVDFSKTCDGFRDCSDGSDESKNICYRIICPPNTFRCLYGGCISKSLRCDGKEDCSDGSDEFRCQTKCKDNEFTCFSGECVSQDMLCDKKYDCKDRSDEKYDICKKMNCPVNTYRCKVGGCIHNNLVCDGAEDCFDGSDESGVLCGNYRMCQGASCRNTTTFCPPISTGRITAKCEIQAGLQRSIIPCDKPLPPGTTVSYECKPYYVPENVEQLRNKEMVCQFDGHWNKEQLKCIPDCGKAQLVVTPLILNGFMPNPGSFPWFAGLFSQEKGKWQFFCGGTIITEKLILTAAHCVWNNKENNILVAVGKMYSDFYKIEYSTQIRSVAKIVSHPLYQDVTGNFGSDIAILILEKSVKFTDFILPACIDSPLSYDFESYLPVNQTGMIAGMGITENDTYSEYLRATYLMVVEDEHCILKQKRDFKKYVTFTSFCAGWKTGTGVCNGDSGGGLVFPMEKEIDKYAVRGIVSVSPRRPGTSFCDNKFYTIFTKVDLYLRWIQGIIFETHEQDMHSEFINDEVIF